ncbi:MAG: hypothetical protein OHK0022_51480 [Roseiflexaceae bacterium]
MRDMLVHSTKYDGSLHYRYTSRVVREEPGVLILYSAPGTTYDSYRGQLLATRHSLEILWPDRFYNLHVSWRDDWQPHNHYINIATPATWNDGVARFVDLDLDVIWRAATGEIILDDEDEFALHQVRFGYPPDLIARCWQAADEVRDLIARRVAPFDGTQHHWRPHGSA